MKKSAEEAAKMNSDYGNRDDSSYGSISDVSGILKEFKEDMKEYMIKTLNEENNGIQISDLNSMLYNQFLLSNNKWYKSIYFFDFCHFL